MCVIRWKPELESSPRTTHAVQYSTVQVILLGEKSNHVFRDVRANLKCTGNESDMNPYQYIYDTHEEK
jgi:hypothetical protein